MTRMQGPDDDALQGSNTGRLAGWSLSPRCQGERVFVRAARPARQACPENTAAAQLEPSARTLRLMRLLYIDTAWGFAEIAGWPAPGYSEWQLLNS